MTIVMYLVAGLILGGLMFLMIRRAWKKSDTIEDLVKNDRTVTCPCGINMAKVDGAYQGNFLRGHKFKCRSCAQVNFYDLAVDPAKRRDNQRRRRRG